jgi:hypothetical protein
MELETRVARLEAIIESQTRKIDCQDAKLDTIMEQVMLGKHLVTFAKMAGWVIGVLAALAEAYRAVKGG